MKESVSKRAVLGALLSVLGLGFLFNVVSATKCTPGPNSKYVGLEAPLVQHKNYFDNPRNKFVISGTVKIVDGCKFVVKKFTFPSNLAATWYGNDKSESEGYRIIKGVIAPSNGEDRIFTLSDSPDSSYDWHDFDTLTIFYKDTVYAEAHFPELEPGSNFVGRPSSPNAPAQSTKGSLVSDKSPTKMKPNESGSKSNSRKKGGMDHKHEDDEDSKSAASATSAKLSVLGAAALTSLLVSIL